MKPVGTTLQVVWLASLVVGAAVLTAPEISPGWSVGALALLTAVLLVVCARADPWTSHFGEANSNRRRRSSRRTRRSAGMMLLLMGLGLVMGAVSTAPEISSATGLSALVLLSGAILVIRGRRKH